MKTKSQYFILEIKKHTEQINDSTLWDGLKEGTQASLNGLVKTHYASLFRYGVALGFNPEIVKDAIQDIFIYIWEHRSTISAVQNVKAYLLYALRSRLIRDTHQSKKEKTFWQRLLNTKEVQNGFDLDWIDTEMDSENNRQVHQIISILPPREKEVIQLRFYEGLDNEAIANVMGISKQGVANLLARTLKTFRSSWQVVGSLFIVVGKFISL